MMSTQRYLYQVLKAKNSPSGNPQRLTMVYNPDNGDVVRVYDHGYRGDCVPSGSVELPSVDISRSDYHATLRNYRSIVDRS